MVLAYVFIGLFIIVSTAFLLVYLRQKVRINELENALSDELVQLWCSEGDYDKLLL